ncbi:hypothetical protein N692_12370 [Lactiplantibacillus plantarum EGD-AQ4]|nr:hypothetical protein N692_12370 [Lactiplantibacillus plantarum EGD-AQ4]
MGFWIMILAFLGFLGFGYLGIKHYQASKFAAVISLIIALCLLVLFIYLV